MTPLVAELNRWIGLRFIWGESDCILCCADWAARWLGADPAADLRLTYGTAGECQRVTRFFTQPLDCVGPRIVAAGGVPVTVPAPGAVGIVLQVIGAGQTRPFGAVHAGRGRWAAKAEQGVWVSEAVKVLAAWDVGYAA